MKTHSFSARVTFLGTLISRNDGRFSNLCIPYSLALWFVKWRRVLISGLIIIDTCLCEKDVEVSMVLAGLEPTDTAMSNDLGNRRTLLTIFCFNTVSKLLIFTAQLQIYESRNISGGFQQILILYTVCKTHSKHLATMSLPTNTTPRHPILIIPPITRRVVFLLLPKVTFKRKDSGRNAL